MAKRLEKEKALQLRSLGWSYSQIRKEIGVSKATLSVWLCNLPLSEDRMRELRDNNQGRIERYRLTMVKKRQDKLDLAYDEVKDILGNFNKRELFIAGLFLYWGEGGKTGSSVTLSNTDPNVLKFFVKWMNMLGIENKDMKVVLHLYSDMNEETSIKYWSDTLNIPLTNFKKTYRKKSNLSDLSYKNGFGHGTCMVRIYNKKLFNLIMMGIKYLGDTQSVISLSTSLDSNQDIAKV